MVIDRSGSMSAIRNDAEGKINHLIKEQQKQQGDCTLSLYQFSNSVERYCNFSPIKEVGPYKLIPSGSTALFDAIGVAINETGSRLNSMDQKDRPELVIFCIVTDGEENSSKEFSKQQIKEMVSHQTSKYSWQFTFLCADQKTFLEGKDIGFACAVDVDTKKYKQVYTNTSAKFNRMRSAKNILQVNNTYTQDEINEMK